MIATDPHETGRRDAVAKRGTGHCPATYDERQEERYWKGYRAGNAYIEGYDTFPAPLTCNP